MARYILMILYILNEKLSKLFDSLADYFVLCLVLRQPNVFTSSSSIFTLIVFHN